DLGDDIGVDKPQNVSACLLGPQVARRSWTAPAFARDHPRSGCGSCFCSVVGGTVVHHHDLANLAPSLHLQQRRQTSIDHGPAIISRHDNGDGSVEVRPQGSTAVTAGGICHARFDTRTIVPRSNNPPHAAHIDFKSIISGSLYSSTVPIPKPAKSEFG